MGTIVESCDKQGRPLSMAVLDMVQDGLAVFNLEYGFVWTSGAFETTLSALLPLTGKKCYRLLRGLGRPCPDCPLKVEAARGVCVCAFAYPSAREPSAWFDVILGRLEDADGELLGGVCQFRDISRQLITEETLKNQFARERILVEQSRDGMVVLDEEGAVVDSNLQFARMLGYDIAEMPSLHAWDWEARVDKEELLRMLQTDSRSGRAFETQHRRKDGSVYDVEISTNAATFDGKKYILCVCRDVTHAHQAAREREALIKQLQDASAEIKALQGILPVCAYCKRVKNDQGEWEELEVYVRKHSEAELSHGICPECMKEHFGRMVRRRGG